jgi:hypothetical protein
MLTVQSVQATWQLTVRPYTDMEGDVAGGDLAGDELESELARVMWTNPG